MRKKQSGHQEYRHVKILGAYYVTIGLFLVGLLIPESRTWGFNWWAYQPTFVKLLLVIVSIGAGPILWWWSGRISDRPKGGTVETKTEGSFWLTAAITIFLSTVAYILFPSTTHFLGDGYQLLARLTDQASAVKSWDIGASWVNDRVFALLNGPADERALLTYRIVAVGAGLAMLVVTAFASVKLFDNNHCRVLFLLGVTTGGYALQFFGYVENYSLFLAAVVSFATIGLLAAVGKTSRWWAVLPFAVACCCHIFGLTLLPAMLYLLWFDKKSIGGFTARFRTRRRLLLSIMVVTALGIYFYLQYNYYFFRFAFLPLFPDRFTVDNDFLLSPKHLIDVINLVVLLVPGVFIFLVLLWEGSRREFFRHYAGRFLLVLLLSTFVSVFIFNPGIGMPRNWDLFSLVGIPLAVMVYYFFLSSKQVKRLDHFATLMALVLALVTLTPRVISQCVPAIAISHFRNYAELDRIRNRNARMLLVDYYESRGDNATADRERTATQTEFPESSYTNRGKQLLRVGDITQAEMAFRKALEINPIFVDAYANLASCYIHHSQLDSALILLKIADGLNPYNAVVMSNTGTVYMRLGNVKEAEAAYNEALRIDSASVNSLAGLAAVYVRLGNASATTEYLEKLGDFSEMTGEYFLEAVDACMEAGLGEPARVALRIAIERDSDPSTIKRLLAKYPELRR